MDKDREALEARHTWQRLVELRQYPVQGCFDAAHLKEINRRIFQDLPRFGFVDVTPGIYRPSGRDGEDWMKTRTLENSGAVSHVAYSRMDAAAIKRLDTVLASIQPAALRQLDMAAFTKQMGQLYVELDYLHPFSDGNSRTLREFTRQLAEEAGYALSWERFGQSAGGRDVLYIARDRSVNALALPHLQNIGTKRDILFSIDQFEQCRALPDLLRDAISPLTNREKPHRQPIRPPKLPQDKGQER